MRQKNHERLLMLINYMFEKCYFNFDLNHKSDYECYNYLYKVNNEGSLTFKYKINEFKFTIYKNKKGLSFNYKNKELHYINGQFSGDLIDNIDQWDEYDWKDLAEAISETAEFIIKTYVKYLINSKNSIDTLLKLLPHMEPYSIITSNYQTIDLLTNQNYQDLLELKLKKSDNHLPISILREHNSIRVYIIEENFKLEISGDNDGFYDEISFGKNVRYNSNVSLLQLSNEIKNLLVKLNKIMNELETIICNKDDSEIDEQLNKILQKSEKYFYI